MATPAAAFIALCSIAIDWNRLKKRPPAFCEEPPRRWTDTFIESYSQAAQDKRAPVLDSIQNSQAEVHLIDTLKDCDIHWKDNHPQSTYISIEHINANLQLEDRAFVQPINTQNNGPLLVAAVIDGHGGWQVAEYVQRKLGSLIESMINKSADKVGRPLSDIEIGTVMAGAFLSLDEDIMNKVRGTCSLGLSRNAKIGACCVAVVVTPTALITANSGDCKAVYSSPAVEAHCLSNPHSANEESEQDRLRREHPGEADIYGKVFSMRGELGTGTRDGVVLSKPEYPAHWIGLLGKRLVHSACYVKGRLQPTRSFGDFYLKKLEFAYDLESDRPFVQNANSFPYISVLPEVTITPRQTGENSFLLMGSDGVWDFLSAQEAVAIAKSEIKESVHKAAKSVMHAVLTKAAAESGMNVVDLTMLPARRRRQVYDDTSICIVDLSKA